MICVSLLQTGRRKVLTFGRSKSYGIRIFLGNLLGKSCPMPGKCPAKATAGIQGPSTTFLVFFQLHSTLSRKFFSPTQKNFFRLSPGRSRDQMAYKSE
jgi:hypothetical protein